MTSLAKTVFVNKAGHVLICPNAACNREKLKKLDKAVSSKINQLFKASLKLGIFRSNSGRKLSGELTVIGAKHGTISLTLKTSYGATKRASLNQGHNLFVQAKDIVDRTNKIWGRHYGDPHSHAAGNRPTSTSISSGPAEFEEEELNNDGSSSSSDEDEEEFFDCLEGPSSPSSPIAGPLSTPPPSIDDIPIPHSIPSASHDEYASLLLGDLDAPQSSLIPQPPSSFWEEPFSPKIRKVAKPLFNKTPDIHRIQVKGNSLVLDALKLQRKFRKEVLNGTVSPAEKAVALLEKIADCRHEIALKDLRTTLEELDELLETSHENLQDILGNKGAKPSFKAEPVDALRAELAALQAMNEALSGQLEKANSEKNRFAEDADFWMGSFGREKQGHLQSKNQLGDLQSQIDTLKSEIEELNRSLQEKNSESSQIPDEQLGHQQEEIARLTGLLKRTRQHLKKVEGQAEKAHQTEQTLAASEEQLSKLQEQIQEKDQARIHAQRQAIFLQGKIENLTKDNASLLKQIDTLNREKINYAKSIVKLKSAITSLQQEKQKSDKNHQKALATLERTVESEKAKLRKINKKLLPLQSKYAKAIVALEIRRKELTVNEDLVRKLTLENQALRKEIADLQETNASQTDQLRDLTQEKTDYARTMVQMDAQLRGSKDLVQQLQSNKQILLDEISKLSQQVKDLRVRGEDLEQWPNELSELSELLNNNQKEVEFLKKQIGTLEATHKYQLKTLTSRLEAQKTKLETTAQEKERQRIALEKALTELSDALDTAKHDVQEKDDARIAANDRVRQLEMDKEELEVALKENQKELADNQQELQQLERRLKKANEFEEQAIKLYKGLLISFNDQSQELHNLKIEKTKLSEQVDLLKDRLGKEREVARKADTQAQKTIVEIRAQAETDKAAFREKAERAEEGLAKLNHLVVQLEPQIGKQKQDLAAAERARRDLQGELDFLKQTPDTEKEEAQTQIQTLESQLKQNEELLDYYKKALEQSDRQVKTLSPQLAENTKVAKEALEAFKRIQQQTQALQAENQSQKAEIEQLRGQKLKLKLKKTNLTKQYKKDALALEKTVMTKVEGLKKQNSELEAGIQGKEQELAASKAGQEQLENALQSLREQQRKIEESTISTTSISKEESEKQAGGLRLKIQTLENELTSTKDLSTSSQRELSILKNSYQSLQAQKQDVEKQVETQKKELDSQRNQIANLTARSEQLAVQLKEKDVANGQLRGKITSILQGQQGFQRKVLADSRHGFQEIQDENTSLREELEATKDQSQESARGLLASNDRVAELNDVITQQKHELEASTNTQHSLQQKTFSQRDTINSLQETLQQQENLIREAREERHKAALSKQSDISKYRQELQNQNELFTDLQLRLDENHRRIGDLEKALAEQQRVQESYDKNRSEFLELTQRYDTLATSRLSFDCARRVPPALLEARAVNALLDIDTDESPAYHQVPPAILGGFLETLAQPRNPNHILLTKKALGELLAGQHGDSDLIKEQILHCAIYIANYDERDFRETPLFGELIHWTTKNEVGRFTNSANIKEKFNTLKIALAEEGRVNGAINYAVYTTQQYITLTDKIGSKPIPAKKADRYVEIASVLGTSSLKDPVKARLKTSIEQSLQEKETELGAKQGRETMSLADLSALTKGQTEYVSLREQLIIESSRIDLEKRGLITTTTEIERLNPKSLQSAKLHGTAAKNWETAKEHRATVIEGIMQTAIEEVPFRQKTTELALTEKDHPIPKDLRREPDTALLKVLTATKHKIGKLNQREAAKTLVTDAINTKLQTISGLSCSQESFVEILAKTIVEEGAVPPIFEKMLHQCHEQDLLSIAQLLYYYVALSTPPKTGFEDIADHTSWDWLNKDKSPQVAAHRLFHLMQECHRPKQFRDPGHDGFAYPMTKRQAEWAHELYRHFLGLPAKSIHAEANSGKTSTIEAMVRFFTTHLEECQGHPVFFLSPYRVKELNGMKAIQFQKSAREISIPVDLAEHLETGVIIVDEGHLLRPNTSISLQHGNQSKIGTALQITATPIEPKNDYYQHRRTNLSPAYDRDFQSVDDYIGELEKEDLENFNTARTEYRELLTKRFNEGINGLTQHLPSSAVDKSPYQRKQQPYNKILADIEKELRSPTAITVLSDKLNDLRNILINAKHLAISKSKGVSDKDRGYWVKHSTNKSQVIKKIFSKEAESNFDSMCLLLTNLQTIINSYNHLNAEKEEGYFNLLKEELSSVSKFITDIENTKYSIVQATQLRGIIKGQLNRWGVKLGKLGESEEGEEIDPAKQYDKTAQQKAKAFEDTLYESQDPQTLELSLPFISSKMQKAQQVAGPLYMQLIFPFVRFQTKEQLSSFIYNLTNAYKKDPPSPIKYPLRFIYQDSHSNNGEQGEQWVVTFKDGDTTLPSDPELLSTYLKQQGQAQTRGTFVMLYDQTNMQGGDFGSLSLAGKVSQDDQGHDINQFIFCHIRGDKQDSSSSNEHTIKALKEKEELIPEIRARGTQSMTSTNPLLTTTTSSSSLIPITDDDTTELSTLTESDLYQALRRRRGNSSTRAQVYGTAPRSEDFLSTLQKNQEKIEGDWALPKAAEKIAYKIIKADAIAKTNWDISKEAVVGEKDKIKKTIQERYKKEGPNLTEQVRELLQFMKERKVKTLKQALEHRDVPQTLSSIKTNYGKAFDHATLESLEKISHEERSGAQRWRATKALDAAEYFAGWYAGDEYRRTAKRS